MKDGWTMFAVLLSVAALTSVVTLALAGTFGNGGYTGGYGGMMSSYGYMGYGGMMGYGGQAAQVAGNSTYYSGMLAYCGRMMSALAGTYNLSQ